MKKVYTQMLSIILATIFTLLYYFSDSKMIETVSFILIMVILGFNIITFAVQSRSRREMVYRDRLLNALMENKETTYLLVDQRKEKVVYVSKNAIDILGEEGIDFTKNPDDLIQDIFKLPIMEEELRKWNQKEEFVGPMVAYRNANYQATKWLRVKIYPYQIKKDVFHLIQIMDVQKEHDQQHQLITQAGDIRIREKQLNQITASSYDYELNVNVATNEFTETNFKEDKKYFEDTEANTYAEKLNLIVSRYVFEEDQKTVLKELSLEHFQHLTQKKQFDPVSVTYQSKENDQYIWLESTAFFTTNRGEILVSILTKDVTENAEYMRSQNAKLHRALKEAKEANEAKTDFMAMMSHEIRTPMNAIIGLSESVLAQDIPFRVREDVESINSASNNLLSVIDDLLDIPELVSKGRKLEEKEYSVARLFKDLNNMGKEWIDQKKIKLELNVESTLPRTLYGDGGKVRQVLLNILNNATKYTTEGTITITASGIVKGSKCQFSVSIADTGCGMEQEKLKHLFDQADMKLEKESMGLSIAKRLIELLNGEIIVESEVGKGTKFEVVVTQRIADENVVGDIALQNSEKKRVFPFDATGKKVLIVDDNKLNLKVATRLLEPYNITVENVMQAQDCLEKIKAGETYDLILLDQMMPEMDGITTLKELKKLPFFATPVIVLTADAIVGKKEVYLEAGFHDYLSKPIDVVELHEILKKYLKK